MNNCSTSKILICIGLLATGACSQSSVKPMSSGPATNEAKESRVSSVAVQAQGPSKKSTDPARLLGRVYQWTINGEKFSSQSKSLRVGSVVYNQLMKQPGKLNGTIVILSAEKPETDFSVHQIADGVFELQVLDAKADLISIYRDLTSRYGENQVEMAIDYSPIEMEKPTY